MVTVMAEKLTSGQIIKQRLKEIGLKPVDLSREMEITKGTVSFWVNDTTKPSGENLITLCQILGIEPESFREGRIIPKDGFGEISFMLRPAKKKEDLNILAEPTTSYYDKIFNSVPLISAVQAGNWRGIVDDFHPGDADKWVETTAKVSPNAFALRVEGDSMTNPNGMPSIPEGMTVIVDPNVEATNGKIVVARLESETAATIKKLVIDGPNKYLMPLNPRYDKIVINGDCTIVGVVVKMEYDLI